MYPVLCVPVCCGHELCVHMCVLCVCARPLFQHLHSVTYLCFLAFPRQLMTEIATYITKNGFTLVDVTGKPTTWGHWNPAYLNGNRLWSDERGVNSMQILTFLSETFKITGNTMFANAYSELCNSTNQYDQNLVRRHSPVTRARGMQLLL